MSGPVSTWMRAFPAKLLHGGPRDPDGRNGAGYLGGILAGNHRSNPGRGGEAIDPRAEQEPKLGFTAYQATEDAFFDLFARLRAEAIIP